MLTYEEMRADLAAVVHERPGDIRPDDALADLGLDSLGLMRLILKWEDEMGALDHGAFMECATLGEWWAVVRAMQTGAAATPQG